MGVGKTKQTEPSPLIPAQGWARAGWLAGPTLHLALGAVLVVRGPGASAAQACDPVAHVQQHRLQGIGIHAPLVGLRGTLHILHNSACEVFTLSRKGSSSERRVEDSGYEADTSLWRVAGAEEEGDTHTGVSKREHLLESM